MPSISLSQNPLSNFASNNSEFKRDIDLSAQSQTWKGFIQYNSFTHDYTNLAQNFGIVLKHLRQQKSSLGKSIVATVLNGTSSLFRSEIPDESKKDANDACPIINATCLVQNPLFTQKRTHIIGKQRNIREQELVALSSTLTSMLTCRTGTRSEFFSISEKKDYFYLK